jgi:CheY-like chemotaxis protein
MKIMIVDDHQEMRRLLRSTLQGLASEFAECCDGADAVLTFTRERPDWTIMDIAMKPMDGLEATRRIKALVPDARILVLTQHDSPGIRRAAHDAGASAFLSKDRLTEIEHVLATPPGVKPIACASRPPEQS